MGEGGGVELIFGVWGGVFVRLGRSSGVWFRVGLGFLVVMFYLVRLNVLVFVWGKVIVDYFRFFLLAFILFSGLLECCIWRDVLSFYNSFRGLFYVVD